MKSTVLPILRTALNQMLVRNTTIVVGVSGGADSVALLLGLHEIADDFQLRLVVAHYDHAVRADSGEDTLWVQALAAKLKLPFITERRNPTANSQLLAEESARRLRYDFFKNAARESHSPWVAVAHTADDQAETVLHHIVRGTGLAGLAGIPETRELNDSVTLIRPLLKAKRGDLIAALSEWNQSFRVDSTNLDSVFTRNRIRNELLPMLREKMNPQVDDALLRLASQAADSQKAIEQIATSLLADACLNIQPTTVRLDRRPFQLTPVAIVREAIRQSWIQCDWRRQGLGFRHLDQLAEMLQTGSPSQICLPHHIVATCRGSMLELRRLPESDSSAIDPETS
ncbi:tRNA lysidine(34) synthetase TilS [Planctomicrobium sp. SH527]|uniref:tRNA lysidine(34) synthetase TilS n=1 Tax=Planctomicrobium sp. SH527 TaxID=3448123 RepID=UPI003F5B5C53